MWKVNDYSNDNRGYIRVTDGDSTICEIFPFAGIGGVGREAALINARKIANAEQLWDALQGLRDWCAEGCPDGGRYAMTEADAALKMISSVPNGQS